MPSFQPPTPNSLKHKPLTHFSADRLIYASFCAPYEKITIHQEEDFSGQCELNVKIEKK